MIPTIRASGKGKTMDAIKWPVVVAKFAEEEGWTRRAKKTFGTVKTLYTILEWRTHRIIHLSESEFIECTTPRLDNYDVSTKAPPFINWNKRSPLLGGDDNGRRCGCGWWEGIYKSSLYFPINSAVNLKLLWKHKFTHSYVYHKCLLLLVQSPRVYTRGGNNSLLLEIRLILSSSACLFNSNLFSEFQ